MMGLSSEIELSPEAVLRESEPLARKTTFRVGGSARFYAEPANPGDLVELLRFAAREKMDPLCLGRGSNLLLADGELPFVVFRLQHSSWRRIEELDGGRLRIGAGLRLQELCSAAARHGLAGFEFLEGIPGTVGGALRMNAGAMGGAMFDVVESVRLVRPNGDERTLGRDSLTFGYRHCSDLRDAFAVEAVLQSSGKNDSGAIRRTIAEFREQRKAGQPRESSAGCIFKNPEGNSAGRLIDQAGLKGLRVGGAEVSLIHGNFIINSGNATSGDILELIRRIRSEVFEKLSIRLEPEVQLLGRQWNEVL